MLRLVALLAGLLLATNARAQPPPQPQPQPQPYPQPYPYAPYPYPYAPYPYPYPYPPPQPPPQAQPPSQPRELPRLAYRDGDPIPPGYRLVERPRQGLILTGWIVTSVAYGISLMAATSASFENESAWLAVPFAGPWLTLGRREYCEQPDREAGETNPECLADVFVVMGLILDGIMQTAGGTLLLIGYANPKRELVREYARVQLSPMRVGSGYGLGLTLFRL